MDTKHYIDLPEALLPDQAETIPHLDQVLIYSKRDVDTLVRLLPIDILKECAVSFTVEWSSGKYKKDGWKTRIRMVVPSHECLSLLLKHKSALGWFCISHVEVTKDILAPDISRMEAENIIRRFVRFLYIPHGITIKEYDIYWIKQTKEVPEKQKVEKKFDKDKGGYTCYIRNRNRFRWEFAAYARDSKIAKVNCLHVEFRYKSTESVKLLLGIETLEDLIQFDPEVFWIDKGWNLQLMEIDWEIFGKFLLGIDGRRKLDKKATQPKAKRLRGTYTKATLLAAQYFSADGSITAFKQMLADWKLELKKQSGVRTELEKRVLKVDYKRFLKPLELSSLKGR